MPVSTLGHISNSWSWVWSCPGVQGSWGPGLGVQGWIPGFLDVSKGPSTPSLRSLFSRCMTCVYLFFEVIEHHPKTQILCPMAPQGLQNSPKMVPKSTKIWTRRPHLWKMGSSVLRQPYGGLATVYRFRGFRGARNRHENLTPYTTHPRCSKNQS